MVAAPRSETFDRVVAAVAAGGREHHEARVLAHAEANLPHVRRTVRDLPALSEAKRRSAIVISAGPSLRRRNTLETIREHGYDGTLVAVDASFAACLRAGVHPDYVVTLDPHETRVVRWFGDPQWEAHAAKDDYFERQDLDVEFRNNAARRNAETMELVDTHGYRTRAIVASSAPANVVARIGQARMDTYWWNPLVDDPREPGSLTRRLHRINRCPCFNTGGNVGTAAWVFTTDILGIETVALTGMDFGYYPDTPLQQTQLYYEYQALLQTQGDIEDCFVHVRCPVTDVVHYTDPTYHWYAENFRQLLGLSRAKTFNCTEGGVLVDDRLEPRTLASFLEEYC